MQYYSYQQLLAQGNRAVLWRYGFLILLSFITVILLILFLYHRNEGKYRELLIIFALSVCLLGGIQLSHYQQYQTSLDQNAQIIHFLKTVSRDQQVPLKQLKTTQTTLTDHMLLKVKHRYYQVTFDEHYSSYHLQPAHLIHDRQVK